MKIVNDPWMFRSFGLMETQVGCPKCERGTLQIRRSCLTTHALCRACRRVYSLADLAPILDPDDFARVGEVVASCLSDRV